VSFSRVLATPNANHYAAVTFHQAENRVSQNVKPFGFCGFILARFHVLPSQALPVMRAQPKFTRTMQIGERLNDWTSEHFVVPTNAFVTKFINKAY
jgi:hypothetical protein